MCWHCVYVCEYIHEYVSHAPLSGPMGFKFWFPSFSSSTAHWTQWTFCCLHSPAPPIHSVSVYLSLTLTYSSILPLSLSYFLSPSPSSSPQYISFSHALNALLCPPSFLSHSPSIISFFIGIHLCRAALIETQTVSNCMRFCQTLRVSSNVEKCGQRRWWRKEWKTGWYLIIKQSPMSFLIHRLSTWKATLSPKAFSLMRRRIPYIFFISSLHLHLFH